MRSVNWAEVLAGFLLGLSPIAAAWLVRLIDYLRSPERKKYLGDFYFYNRSTFGDGRIFESRVTIKHSYLRSRQTVKHSAFEMNGSGSWSYSGRVSSRKGMVRYGSLKGDSSHELETWYLFDSSHSNVNITSGLYLALDHRGFPAAGPMLLSRKRLSQTRVGMLMDKETLVVDPFNRLMPDGTPPRAEEEGKPD